MSERVIKRARSLTGCLSMPGDKSISHRAALISLLCKEPVEIHNLAEGEDVRQSLAAVRSLGGSVDVEKEGIRIEPPQNGLKSPEAPIDCGNSGTTLRLLAGILAGSKVSATLTGDESLSMRPMKRVVDPLRQMNAEIEVGDEGTPPISIKPATLIPIDYILPVASAQVKSALLLAGQASGCEVTVREQSFTRDHTERMLRFLGGGISVEDVKTETVADPEDPRKKRKQPTTDRYKRSIAILPGKPLNGGVIEIPGDISAAAYFIAAALLVRGSHLIIQGVGVNRTRNAFITILKQMGADIKVKNRREKSSEPVADIEVRYSRLKPRKICGNTISNLIDELPVLAVLAARIEGTTIVRDAAELRYKESDRIKAIVENMTAMGIKVGEFPDGFAIEGGSELNGVELDSFGDHRIAMAFSVAGLAAHGKTIIKGSEAVNVSCPRFLEMLEGLRT